MNRRDFLKNLLGAATCSIIEPQKFYFDFGANLYKAKPIEFYPLDHSVSEKLKDAYQEQFDSLFRNLYLPMIRNAYRDSLIYGTPIIDRVRERYNLKWNEDISK